VVVVGSLNVDLVVTVDRMPAPGETVLGSRLDQHAGGKGLNQAVAAARLGGRVEIVGSLGSDAVSGWLRAVAIEEGVGDATLAEVPGASGTALIEVDMAGANRIIVVPGSNAMLTSEQVESGLRSIENVAVVLVQAEIPLTTVATAMRVGRSLGAITILNPSPVFDCPPLLLSDVDYLVPNEHEAGLLSGMATATADQATEAARSLVGMGAGCVIITRGGDGSVWANADASGTQGAYTVVPVDTVAAGDAFCGGLAAALAEGLDLPAALRWASAAGALATTRPGAVPSLPSRSAMEELISAEPATEL